MEHRHDIASQLRQKLFAHLRTANSIAEAAPQSLLSRSNTTAFGKMINAPNKVPQYQRAYQAAYNAHTRLWMIGSRSRWYMTPYTILLWGSFGATMYAAGRKVMGYNSWFGKA